MKTLNTQQIEISRTWVIIVYRKNQISRKMLQKFMAKPKKLSSETSLIALDFLTYFIREYSFTELFDF